jgi:UrcA family protein
MIRWIRWYRSVLLAAAGFALLPGARAAEVVPPVPAETVTVVAPFLLLKKQVQGAGRTPVLYTSLSGPVSYADLDLKKPADAQLFQTRIRERAQLLCRRLDTLYSPDVYVPVSGQDCVKTSTERAMMVAKDIIAFWQP